MSALLLLISILQIGRAGRSVDRRNPERARREIKIKIKTMIERIRVTSQPERAR
jgi:hypothetical protein